MAIDLPKPLSEFFAAANTDDADRIAACFAQDARVNDEKQEFVGRAAIRQWAVESRRKYKFQSEPLSIEGNADQPAVTAHVTGNFPGNPVDLTYRFVIAGGEIVTLSIG